MLTSPVTGVAVNGLTGPTYTVTADKAPTPNSTQFAVTALGGTQTGVDTAASTRPFTATFFRPSAIKQQNAVDANNVLRNVPNNVYDLLIRKGVTVLSGQPSRLHQIRTQFVVPAGADVADIPNLKAAYSFFGGVVTQAANNMVTLMTTGVMPA
jgi:hypothetical protein